MNKAHRLIWSALRQTWIAVAETVSTRGNRNAGQLLLTASLLTVIGATTSMAQTPPPPHALPTAGQLVAGTASISQNGANMAITQTSNRAAIDWQTFNIGCSATVNFLQPSSSAVTLNRVQSGDPSQIFGQINANGQVFLSNPAGVYFAPSASVNVSGLVATTHGISTADFLAARTRFTRDGATGSVVNDGALNASLGGYIALLAPEVRNRGVVIAQTGTVALAAGEAYEMQFSNGSLANIQVDPSTVAALVENSQAVLAPGGLIILSARAADQLQGSVVNNSGKVEARGLIEMGGRIVLTADHINLASGSTLDASGVTGGGEVLVGGGWQGSGGLYQATTVSMAGGATIDVSAGKSGPGGTAVLWSDVHNAASQTRAYGSIWAKGGVEIGDGGRIETSGHWLDVSGSTGSAAAIHGEAGLWLFDPYNVEITSTNQNNQWQLANPTVGGTDVYSSIGTPSKIAASDIAARLQNGSNVTITTISNDGYTQGPEPGVITVNSAIVKTSGNYDVTLTLQAANSIVINNSIVSAGGTGNTGKLNLVLNAYSLSNGPGGITVNTGSTLLTNGGNILMGASCGATACAFGAQGTGQAGTGGISFNGTSGNLVTLNTGGGVINLWGSGPNAGGSGIVMRYANLDSGAGGAVSLRGDGYYVNTPNGNGHGIYLDHSIVRGGSGGATLIGNGNANNTSDGQWSTGFYLTNSSAVYTTNNGQLLVSASNTAGNGTENAYVLSDATSRLGDASLQNGDMSLNYSGNSSSPVYLPNITLPSGNLTVISHRGIAAANSQTIAGTSTLNAGGIGFDIDLASSGTFDTGTLSATNVRHLSVKDVNALIIGASTISGNLSLQSGGAITQSGNLTVLGSSTMAAGSNDVILDRVGNRFTGPVSIVSGANVSLKDADSLTLGTTNITGSLNAEALAGDLALLGNITEGGLLNATATFKATGSIIQDAGTSIASNNSRLNTLLWADSDANGGAIFLKPGSVISSHGGSITLSGGTDPTTGYAKGVDSTANLSDGISLIGATLQSNGGDITLRGTGAASSASADTGNTSSMGIVIGTGNSAPSTGTVLDSGTGKITITGVSGATSNESNADSNFHAVEIGTGQTAHTGNVTIRSANASADAISISGDASALTSPGTLKATGVQVINPANRAVVIEATAGGIVIDAKASQDSSISTEGYGFRFYSSGNTAAIVAAGPISITGQGNANSGSSNRDINLYSGTIGYAAGTNVTNSSTNITLHGDTLSMDASSRLQSTGTLAIQPRTSATTIGLAGGAGTLVLSDAAFSTNFTNGFSGITIGSAASGAITVGGTLNLYDSTTLQNNSTIAINGAVNSTENLTLTSNGAITQTAGLTVAGTTRLTAGLANDITLNNSSNSFGGAVSVVSANNVALSSAGAMKLGAVHGAGTLDIATLIGDLELTGQISTSSATVDAITLNAGKSASAGNPDGGNIRVKGGTVTPGAGGFATLYSGNVLNSTGLTTLIGSGSGRFRYNSDEQTGSNRYVTALVAGTNAVYREQPTLSITADDKHTTYGDIPVTTSTIGPTQNVDTFEQAVSGSIGIAIGGNKSPSDNYIAGDHSLTPSGLASLLGYRLSYIERTLTVSPLALIGSITGGGSVYGSALTPGTASFGNAISGDAVSPGAVSVDTTGLLSSSGHLKAGTHSTIQSVGSSLGGADAANYSFAGSTAAYTVTPLSLSGAAIAAVSTPYGTDAAAGVVSFSNLISGDLVTSSATISGPAYSSSHNVRVGAYYQSASGLLGNDAGNYSFSSGFTTATANYQVLVLDLPVHGLNANNKVYDGTNVAFISGTPTVTRLGVDHLTLIGQPTAYFNDNNVGAGKAVTIKDLSLSGADVGNYRLVQPTGLTASITAPSSSTPPLQPPPRPPPPPTFKPRNLPTPNSSAPEFVYDGLAIPVPPRTDLGDLKSGEGVDVNMTQEATEDTPGVVAVSIRKALNQAGGPISFQLPANLFGEQALTEATATLANAAPMPFWLQFSAATRGFSLYLPQSGLLPIEVVVTMRRKRALISIADLTD